MQLLTTRVKPVEKLDSKLVELTSAPYCDVVVSGALVWYLCQCDILCHVSYNYVYAYYEHPTSIRPRHVQERQICLLIAHISSTCLSLNRYSSLPTIKSVASKPTQAVSGSWGMSMWQISLTIL